VTTIWKSLKTGPSPPDVVYALIEIPKGSNVKFEMDHETGIIFVDRVLYTAFKYPFDYGIIPQTWYLDNDPMDIMVLSRVSLFPGCVVPARPIAFVRMRDEAGEDNKVLAVPAKDPYWEDIKDIADVPKGTLSEIKHFLEHYKDLEPGKWVKVESWENASSARSEIKKAMAMFLETFSKKD
jgi:inorganic pyrophosphatase